MKYKVDKIKNGDMLVDFYTYYCEKCGTALPENNPQHIHEDKHYCGDCAFKEGLITGEELKKDFYYWIATGNFQDHRMPIILENEIYWITKSMYNKIKEENYRIYRTE